MFIVFPVYSLVRLREDFMVKGSTLSNSFGSPVGRSREEILLDL